MSQSINERIARVKGWDLAPGLFGADPVGVVPRDTMLIAQQYRNWQHSIADAWELVEEMRAAGWVPMVCEVEDIGTWRCIGTDPAMPGQQDERDWERAGEAPTAPKAICLAWLSVMEKEDE